MSKPPVAANRWRPAWLPLLAMALVLPVLLYLGNWQLDRADEKRVMFDSFGSAGNAVELATLLDQPPEEVRYRQVHATGSYRQDKQFLLEGMTHEGQPGLHVLTPFVLADGRIVMVNRGWIPETRTRQTMPQLPVEQSQQTLAGRVVPYPQPGLRLAAEPATGWPRRAVYPTASDIAMQAGFEVQPHMLWLAADAPGGFVRDWKPHEFGPARHIGYAVQWFGLAITLVMIYLILRFRRKR